MAHWLVRRTENEDGAEVYEVVRDGEALTSVAVRADADMGGLRAAVLMLRARVIGRLEDPAPVFGYAANNPHARPFVEMLNEAA
jgi:hypothetical protein